MTERSAVMEGSFMQVHDLADNDMDNMLFCRELGLGYYDVFGRREEACREAMGAVEVWMRR